jgi:hypothetical protein
MLVEQIINEKYVNAVGTSGKAMAIKQKYVDEVWDILQKSYANIGGIKGNGFESPEALLQIPMWKLGIRDGTVKAVAMYKDKGGRKAVAIGTDGSVEAKWFVGDIFRNEIKRSYGEKSKAALSMLMKLVPWEGLEPHLHSPAQVAVVVPNIPITPITDVPKDEWPADALMTLNRYPQLVPYGYMRELAGEQTFKVMIGSPGKDITAK